MESQHYIPIPSLRPYIKSFWTIRSSINETDHFRFAPDGHPELFFSLDGKIDFSFNGKKVNSANRFGIIGNFEHNSDMDISQNTLTFLVKFHTHSLPALLPNDCNTLINDISVVPSLVNLYHELLSIYQTSSNILAIIQCTENWLLDHLKPFPHQKLISDICHTLQLNNQTPIRTIFEGYGLSQRRLQQIFKEKVGISPKQFQRISRFRIAMKHLDTAPQKEEFIHTLGYYDWAHFSKDMFYFFEISPSDYVHYLFKYGKLINVQR